MTQVTAKNKYILVVDDVVDNLRLLSDMLRHQGYEVRCTKNGKAALKAVLEKTPDLILLDIQMPNMNGFEICEQLKKNSATQNIPVIFLSAADNIESKVEGFRVGAVDYITKPFQMEEVIIRVQNQILLQSATQQIYRLNNILKEQFGKEKHKNQELEIINAKLQHEISARKKAEQQLVHDALHDSLTGLPNRTFLMDKVDHSIKLAKRNPDYLFAVLFVDLNRFKSINDTLGHAVGDQLLIEVANILQQNLRETDTVSRLGGDEFVILLEQLDSLENTVGVTKQLLKELQQLICIEGKSLSIGASIGIVLGADVYQNSSQILRDADIAMYQAKRFSKIKGTSKFEIFDKSMSTRMVSQSELERDLHHAVKNSLFHLDFQPIISLETNKIEGFEALVGWKHFERGLISPEEFIPLAEDIGQIVPLGDWILKCACEQLAIWQEKFAYFPESSSWKMSINISSHQLQELNFFKKLKEIIQSVGLNSSCIKLEITETALIESEPIIQKNLSKIQECAVNLSVDNFGIGYSSLNYLHRLPIDSLKIDCSFIKNITSNPENLTIVKTLTTLAHTLNVNTIAQGIENREQIEILQRLNCGMGQGCYFAEPLSSLGIESWLTEKIYKAVYT